MAVTALANLVPRAPENESRPKHALDFVPQMSACWHFCIASNCPNADTDLSHAHKKWLHLMWK